jgi:hypothetical protein
VSLALKDSYDEVKERLRRIPENYERISSSEVETAQIIDPEKIFKEARKSQPAHLLRLYTKTKKFYTPKPISVKIYREEALFFAENETLVVCGTGATVDEALQDFSLHILHFFEYYKKLDKNKLTGDALRLKDIFENLLIEGK